LKWAESGLFGFWRRFGSVTGFFKPAPSPKPRQKPKILAPHRYIFSVNALAIKPRRGEVEQANMKKVINGSCSRRERDIFGAERSNFNSSCSV
jgi:hypothetical protein